MTHENNDLTNEAADRWLNLLEQAEADVLASEMASFSHQTHLLVGWRLATTMTPTRAIERMCAALRRGTRLLGATAKYHETLTWTWMLLLLERVAATPNIETFEAFLEAHPELLDGKACIARHYDDAFLGRPEARTHFLLPRRKPSKSPHGLSA